MAGKNESSVSAHDSNGVYDCDLDATDTNTVGPLDMFIFESAAVPVKHEFMVLPANVYDSLVAGTDKLETDPVSLDGDATAMDNLVEGANAIALFEAQSGSTSGSIITNRTEATDDHFNNRRIIFLEGTLALQEQEITDYVGSTKTATVAGFTGAPANGDRGVII